MPSKISITVKVFLGERERLQEIARSFGLVQTTGQGIGEIGSLSQLLHAITTGEIKLSKDTPIVIPPKKSIEDKFWNKVNKDGPIAPHMTTPCWIWTAFKYPLPRDYGIFMIKKGQAIRAHRFSWEITNHKSIPKGLLVCHHCDTPSCVNPEHLFLGTPKDNGQDASMKKRVVAPKGENSPHAKLTWDKVNEIRFKWINGTSQKQLTKEYDVNKATISSIVRNKTWKI